MEKLPKYFVIKADLNNPLWFKYINWLKETYKIDLRGNAKGAYYGFQENKPYNKSVVCKYIKDFKNNPTVITLKEWDEAVNGKPSFVLPKKWCIKNTDLDQEAKDWFQSYDKDKLLFELNYYGNFPFNYSEVKYGGISLSKHIRLNQIITLEQFKKYILMKDEKEIIGYKLKDEFINNNNVIKSACRIEGYFNFGEESIKQSVILTPEMKKVKNSIEKLRNAKVLDVWFEPVYASKHSFKKGDYVRWNGASPCVGIIVGLNEHDGRENYILEKTSSVKSSFTSCYFKNLTLITKEEYEVEFIRLPKINGYNGELRANNTEIKYGCALIAISKLKKIYDCKTLSTIRNIKSITLDSNVEITIEEINQILEYVENQ